MTRWLPILTLVLLLTACGQQESADSAETGTVLIGLVEETAADIGDTPLEAGEGMQVITIGVEGMHCEQNCAPKAYQALASVEGVENVRVSLAEKKAWVVVPEVSPVTADGLATKVNDSTGFKASVTPASATPSSSAPQG